MMSVPGSHQQSGKGTMHRLQPCQKIAHKSRLRCSALQCTPSGAASTQNESESYACLRLLCPGCPLGLSQPAGESRRFTAEGMGRPLSNRNLNFHIASRLCRMTDKRAQDMFTLWPICVLTATYFLLQIYNLFASCWCGSPTVLKPLNAQGYQWLATTEK